MPLVLSWFLGGDEVARTWFTRTLGLFLGEEKPNAGSAAVAVGRLTKRTPNFCHAREVSRLVRSAVRWILTAALGKTHVSRSLPA